MGGDMIISVINHADKQLSDAEVQQTLRAVNRQIAEDFLPYWSVGAMLRLEGKSTSHPQTVDLPDMRGDAVLYLWDKTNVDDALGYHEQNNRGIPFGFVFTELSKALGESWTATLSHEALELIADPDVNLLVQGPHPSQRGKSVFYWYEMCDAVQDETYEVDGVEVSNFLLPLYFTGSEEGGCRNDFLGHAHPTGPKGEKRTLVSFGMNPGGYLGFFNPATGKHQTVSLPGDKRAARRLAAKQRFGAGRRGSRYQRFVAKDTLTTQTTGTAIRVARRPGPPVAATAASARRPFAAPRPSFVPQPGGVTVLDE
jgi:hypothetical protein